METLKTSKTRKQKANRRRLEALALHVKERDNWRCVACGRRKELECHHILSVAEGGKHEMASCVTLCRGCHIAHHGGKLYRPRREWDRFIDGVS